MTDVLEEARKAAARIRAQQNGYVFGLDGIPQMEDAIIAEDYQKQSDPIIDAFLSELQKTHIITTLAAVNQAIDKGIDAAFEEKGTPFVEKVKSMMEEAIVRGAEAAIANVTKNGFVIVPKEATEEMIIAGIAECHGQPVPEAWSLATKNVYAAMIAAALQGRE